jgi:hypothetical protein
MKIPKKDKKTLESLFKYDSADEMYFLRNEEGEFIEYDDITSSEDRNLFAEEVNSIMENYFIIEGSSGTCENEIDSRLWDYIDLDEDDKLKFNYLVEYWSYDIDEAFDNYQDVIFFDGMTLKAVAEELVDEGLFGEVSNNLKWYLDYEAIARDLERDGYTETSDGVFFYNG